MSDVTPLILPSEAERNAAPRKMSPGIPLLDRVLLRVEVDLTGCWRFTGAHDQGGYGMVRMDGVNHRAHVVTWRAAHRGADPRPLVIDHLCRVRDCCNPAHLQAVEVSTNLLRGFRNTWPIATHCLLGHAMTEANTYLRPDNGGRQCRACIKRRSDASAVRRRARQEP